MHDGTLLCQEKTALIKTFRSLKQMKLALENTKQIVNFSFNCFALGFQTLF